jgi:hypothetical protein
LLVGAPSVLIGIAPLALSIRIGTASSKAAYALSGIGSLLLFAAIIVSARRCRATAYKSFSISARKASGVSVGA